MNNLIADMETRGHFVRRGESGYDGARQAWQLSADLRPAAVARPVNAEEVTALVRYAAENQWRVAPISTGHIARGQDDLDKSLLLWTTGLTGVRVDPDSGKARVGGGDIWMPAVEQATRHGLAALHGSSPNVGVTGYSLGGGLSFYGRKYGLAANHVTAVELVTADGQPLRVDAHHDTDLFWALRGGGGGNFGVVTALEFDLIPVPTAYAGALLWDLSAAPTVLPRWLEWTKTAPDSVTTSYRHLQFPPLPDLPELLRGRRLVMIDGAVLEDDDEAARLLAPLRTLKPETDTFTRMPDTGVARIHMDPEQPLPAVGRSAGLLGELPAAAADKLLEVAGPDSGSSLGILLELRQLGGALGREHPGGGALDRFDGEFLSYCGTLAPDAAALAQAVAQFDRLTTAMKPWTTGRQYLNYVEVSTDASPGFPADRWAELRRIRTEVDPSALFQAVHGIPVS